MKIGITGAIASGKSSAVSILSGYIDCCVIDADAVGRQVAETDYELCKRIARQLGEPSVLAEHGLDRRATAEIVFKDPQKLLILNRIIHPPMLREIRKQIKNCTAPNLILDAALLPDWDTIRNELDGILMISAEEPVRLNRLINKGYDKKHAVLRISSQHTWDEKKKKCKWIIENNRTIEELEEKIRKWWEKVNINQ